MGALATDDPRAAALMDLSTALVRRTFWIVGGDGWAYDIGYGGLDHVLASGHDVNILVMDTEVYSNTGGQASKATPRGAVAKFAASGKGLHKKDLGLEAMSLRRRVRGPDRDGRQRRADREGAGSRPRRTAGPSLVIAYSTCIAHGFDMADSMKQQKLAVKSGHWPLYRYRPSEAAERRTVPPGLEAPSRRIPFAEFARKEARFSMLFRTDPERAKELLASSEADIAERWKYYEQLAGIQRSAPQRDPGEVADRRLEDGEADE